MVAGGIGIAPLLALAKGLRQRGKKLKAFIGGESRKDILCVEEFEKLGVRSFVATEDGSLGEKGLVTKIFKRELKNLFPSAIYACGPLPMLKVTSRIVKRYNIPCQLSLEARMTCGLGACLGCVIKTSNEGKVFYKRVCTEGSVFDAGEVVW